MKAILASCRRTPLHDTVIGCDVCSWLKDEEISLFICKRVAIEEVQRERTHHTITGACKWIVSYSNVAGWGRGKGKGWSTGWSLPLDIGGSYPSH